MRALLLLPLIVYLALPTRNYYWDGIGIAGDIEKRLPVSALLYPSHLLFALGGSFLYRAALVLGFKTRALFLMQSASAIFAGLSIPLVYRILRRHGAAAPSSIAGALIFAFSATWWKFATDANAYMPAIFFLLCAYLLLEDGRVIPAALAHAAAMLFHELAILFLPVAWIMLRGRRRVQYCAGALVPTIAAYLIACRLAVGELSAAKFLSWVTLHSPDSGFSFAPLKDAILTLRGTLRLVFGGRLDAFSGAWISRAALAGFGIASALFLWRLGRAAKPDKFAKPPAPILLWIACYTAFLFVWMPQNTFYRLFYLPPLIAAGVLLFRRPLTGLAPVLIFWNFAFLIYPDSLPSHNAPLSFAMAQQSRWPPGTPIVFHRFHPDLWTISYFTPGTSWFGLDQMDASALNRMLDYAHSQAQPLWVEADAYELIASSADGRQWLSQHDRPQERIEFRDERHDFRFYCER